MPRLLAASVALVITLNLVAAPVPKDVPKEQPLYFPTKVGTKWVYAHGDEDQTEVITAAEYKTKERLWVVQVTTSNKEKRVTEWEVSDQGLFWVMDRGKERATQCWLKLPHKAGEKWDLVPEYRFRCVTLESQKIKVPAGEFDAIGVEIYLGDTLFVTRWYAPGVGLVKLADEKSTRSVLKSFTPGKD